MARRPAEHDHPRRSLTISRADLAACMLALSGDRATVRRQISIAS
ncbi:MAG TPA: hypothetical protein VMK13_12850 [Streptosporangiaceae bacterium]|nr:hypothetical protein [Streptosporangiaceae bacterium]